MLIQDKENAVKLFQEKGNDWIRIEQVDEITNWFKVIQ